jgi:hypothetical protein
MAATRLRRTFQYPSESDDEDAVEQGMDEQGTYCVQIPATQTLRLTRLPQIKPT